MKKIEKNSFDLKQEKIKQLKKIFPDIFEEDKINFKKLKENLGEFLDDDETEKYQFTWFGKKRANRLALTQTSATLRPDKNSSKNWDETQNIYIEGDNLEVLKAILKSYYKKIKMIYIDPPYNTGKEFIYKDNYSDNLKNYLKMTGQIDDNGTPLSSNLEKSGRKHSNWLNMMYPRLKVARELLKDEGVIFVSIDDNEVANLRKIMDEIFGEENFVGEFIWKKRSGGGYTNALLSINHEYILIYSKKIDEINFNDKIKNEEKIKKYYNYKDEIGFYKRRDLRKAGTADRKIDRPTMYFPIKAPDGTNIFPIKPNGEEGRWSMSYETVKKLLDNNELEFVMVNNIWKVYYKERPFDNNGNTKSEKYETILYDIANNTAGTNEVKTLFNNKKYFNYPKPVALIKHLLKIGTNTSDLILDFFSGSATTAHATIELNAEDGGNRKFILVQLPEPTNEKSEAYRAGYKNICEIGKERIRRAGEKIKKEKNIKNLDIGFRVFKLDSTNFVEWDESNDNLFEKIEKSDEVIKKDRSEEDILFEIILKCGLPLSAKIEIKKIENKKVYIVENGNLIAVFDEIDIEVAKRLVEILKSNENSILFLKDEKFKTSSDKVNILNFFKQEEVFEKVIIL